MNTHLSLVIISLPHVDNRSIAGLIATAWFATIRMLTDVKTLLTFFEPYYNNFVDASIS